MDSAPSNTNEPDFAISEQQSHASKFPNQSCRYLRTLSPHVSKVSAKQNEAYVLFVCYSQVVFSLCTIRQVSASDVHMP